MTSQETGGGGYTLPEITRTDCLRCGTEVHGLAGRYACPMCGWVNHWSEGYSELPTAADDPDWPGEDTPA
ncbi:hypothetical protein [Streptomyces sp. PR69]|uniref:hypothetical protein n=1 Tax=Streptomyces sp. PR69 TaxID=2984950 RepID=UPI002263D5A7|nr:hypothetical protein [Streptomyces sp. PR69]